MAKNSFPLQLPLKLNLLSDHAPESFWDALGAEIGKVALGQQAFGILVNLAILGGGGMRGVWWSSHDPAAGETVLTACPVEYDSEAHRSTKGVPRKGFSRTTLSR